MKHKQLTPLEYVKLRNEYVENREYQINAKKNAKNVELMNYNEASLAIFEAQKKTVSTAKLLENFLVGAKESLLAECIYSVYNKALDITKQTYENDLVKRNLVNSFVKENGADALIRRFKNQSILLSEFAIITEKYYNKIKETVDKNNPDSFTIAPEIQDDFYAELDMADVDDVVLTIRERVARSAEEFINKNIADKMDIQDIIQGAQERIGSTTSDDIKESFNMQAKNKIHAVRDRNKNVYHKMVELTCEAAIKNEDMKKAFMIDNKLDMDKVIESVDLMYTLLETINTAKMSKIDESYIEEMLDSMR
jgi:hypothetical protein